MEKRYEIISEIVEEEWIYLWNV